MTKQVFSRNAQVAHIWGQQTQDTGRSPTPGNGGGRFGFSSGAYSADSCRVSFKGRVFYSYAEPVARLVETAPAGALALLVTAGQVDEWRPNGESTYASWSPSTSGHISDAIGAVSHLIGHEDGSAGRVYRVPHIGGHRGSPGEWEGVACEVDHIGNASHLANRYRAAVALYSGRAKIRQAYIAGIPWDAPAETPRYLSDAETISAGLREAFAAALDYCDSFLAHCGKDRFAPLGDMPRDFATVEATAADIAAEREARAARALAKLTPAELARRAARKVASAEKAERSRALRYASADEKLAGWREGLRVDSYALPRGDSNGGAYIRATGVKRDKAGQVTGGTLETSQGASVPLCHAIRAFRFLKLCRDRGRGWDANGRTIRVGHFNISRVDPAGDFVAGCHRINWPEVAALAVRLGVFDLPPADDALEPSGRPD